MIRPVGFAGISLSPRSDFSLDLGWSRSAIDSTPLSVRLGVVESRLEGGLNFSPDPRTELHLSYFKAKYSSASYDHASIVNPGGTIQTAVENRADRERATGGSVVFNRNLVRSDRVSFDLGYSGLAYGYKSEGRRVYLGFFDPNLYQRHLVTTRLYGKLWGPVGYHFSGGIGLQQVRQRQALTRGLLLNPALTVKVSRRLSLRMGYVHYNFAQALGPISGNAVQLSSDFKF